MAARIIRSRELVRTPWKNGAGTTSEVLVEPPGADLERFDWRISMADVASAGPFSPFEGIDRSLALIEGAALELDIQGVVRRLDAASPIVSFSGDARTSARLPSGPIRDFNVMTRRERFAHRMRLIRSADAPVPWEGSILVFAPLEDTTLVTVGGESFYLDRLDVSLADPSPGTIRVSRPTLLIELQRR